MFDNIIVPKTQVNNPSETAAKPPLPAGPGKPLEDIFTETDKGGPVKSLTGPLPSLTGQSFPNPQLNDGKEKKYFIFGLVVFIVILLLGGAIWAFNIFFRPAKVNNIADTNTTVGNEAVNSDQNSAASQKNLENSPITDSTQNLNDNNNATSSAPAMEQSKDSDQDGLTDDEETVLGTNPNDADSDHDGLFDREEVKVYKTDPLNPDTDGDTYSDGAEVKSGYNPNGAGKLYEIK